MSAADTNLNLAECIKSTSDFGVTHIHNVCSGAVAHIAWGHIEWLTLFGVSALALSFFLMMSSLGFLIWSDR
jgi:hypothetical protein